MYLLLLQLFSMFDICSFRKTMERALYFNNVCFGFGQIGSWGLVWSWSCFWLPSVSCIGPFQLFLVLSHLKSLRCVCWQEQPQLTVDKWFNEESDILGQPFHLISLSSSFYLHGFALWGHEIADCLTREKSCTFTAGSNYLCGWKPTQELLQTLPSGTRNRKRDKNPHCFAFTQTI